MKNAQVLDLAIFLGYSGMPSLDEVSAAHLDAAKATLTATHPTALLELMREYQRSGMAPRRPQPTIQPRPESGGRPSGLRRGKA